MNKNSVYNVESILVERCKNVSCPVVECTSDTGFLIVSVPICKNGRCSSTGELSCRLVCEYNTFNREPYITYIQNAAEEQNTTSDKMIQSCGCNI
ncbi:MAG TPA: hypothetical protein ENN30_02575 [Candidatus Woesearchaeota archaeon]|nr:hypothetical protein [Candidatus Woesearchaeota archaeon]